MRLRIGDRHAGDGVPCFVIAEVGVNHNGDVELAKNLVSAARAAGADCVKFQTYTAERVAGREAPKADYQRRTTDSRESQLEMLKALELPRERYPEILRHCADEGILFLSTPYDLEDVDFLVDLGVPALKVASGQAAEPVFVEHVASKGLPVLMSTGMCTMAEVGRAVDCARDTGNTELVLFQCTTAYPAPVGEANLRAICTMREALGVLTGYSDHTPSTSAALGAVALGACAIERHLTLDRNMSGPDHASSSEPAEMASLITQIRELECALGDGVKAPTPSERANIAAMRRSIAARVDIARGEKLTLDHLAMLRPGTGLGGSMTYQILGRHARRNIRQGETLDWAMID